MTLSTSLAEQSPVSSTVKLIVITQEEKKAAGKESKQFNKPRCKQQFKKLNSEINEIIKAGLLTGIIVEDSRQLMGIMKTPASKITYNNVKP